MIEDEDSVAVSEAKRQTVILVFSVAGAVILMYLSAMQHDVPARQRAIMRAALGVKRVAQWNAQAWEGLAMKAATVYNRYRD